MPYLQEVVPGVIDLVLWVKAGQNTPDDISIAIPFGF